MLPDLHVGFSRGRSGSLVFPSLSNFPQFIVIHIVKGSGTVNKAEIDVFLELSCFFDDPADAGKLISDSSAFSKTSLNIWQFRVHMLLKPGLENVEQGWTSGSDELLVDPELEIACCDSVRQLHYVLNYLSILHKIS